MSQLALALVERRDLPLILLRGVAAQRLSIQLHLVVILRHLGTRWAGIKTDKCGTYTTTSTGENLARKNHKVQQGSIRERGFERPQGGGGMETA